VSSGTLFSKGSPLLKDTDPSRDPSLKSARDDSRTQENYIFPLIFEVFIEFSLKKRKKTSQNPTEMVFYLCLLFYLREE
jgi:hypothetical protein